VSFLSQSHGSALDQRTPQYNASVPELPQKKPTWTPVVSAIRTHTNSSADEEKMTCERCGADMYRMHAVWRCPACRFKTDCCGW
jgi:rubrerythrin